MNSLFIPYWLIHLGSTGTTVIVWRCTKNNKRYIQSANLGDSTAFLVRNGKSGFLSEDHKLTIQSERQRIMNMGITLSPDQTRLCGLAVARAFGDAFPKVIELSISHSIS
jgi:serine/threonine protein phosphatase PrpC